MSSRVRSNSENSYDDKELLQIGSRCLELRKEKDLLKESQSQGFELIKKLEQHVKSLSQARTEDKNHIEDLEKELMNCSQEINYLQDQLKTRNTELNGLKDHIQSLELELSDMENLHEKVERLEEELKRSNLECIFLMQELEKKEVEIQNSNLCIEKLEATISSTTLESQFEIESMKIDMMALELSCFEAKKALEEDIQEKAKMRELIQELEVQFENSQMTTISLYKENNELRGELETAERIAMNFCQMFEEWIENKDRIEHSFLSDLDGQLSTSDEQGCGKVWGPLLPKLATFLSLDSDLKGKAEEYLMLNQIQDYELVVKQLKEELREEKLKAKEEAEDLAQEMAELRYQITGLLEEECKRRACIERASLQRISQLEAQVLKGQRKDLEIVRVSK